MAEISIEVRYEPTDAFIDELTSELAPFEESGRALLVWGCAPADYVAEYGQGWTLWWWVEDLHPAGERAAIPGIRSLTPEIYFIPGEDVHNAMREARAWQELWHALSGLTTVSRAASSERSEGSNPVGHPASSAPVLGGAHLTPVAL